VADVTRKDLVTAVDWSTEIYEQSGSYNMDVAPGSYRELRYKWWFAKKSGP
jgi:hypothetical protein